MKKNKLIIALSSLIIIVIIGVAIIIGLNKKKPITKDIYLARWDKSVSYTHLTLPTT